MTLIRWLLLLSNLALVVGLAGGMAARYVHPRHAWWLQVVALGLPWFALGLVALALAWSGEGRWWLVALNLALAALVLQRYVGLPDRIDSDAGPALSVVAFNAKPEKLRPEGQDGIELLLRDSDPDVAALQGVGVRFFRDGSMTTSALMLPMLENNRYSVPRPEGAGAQTIRPPILTRLEWLAAAQPFVENDTGDESTRATWVELEWEGDRIVVINLHLESFGRRRPWQGDWETRLSPAEWLRTIRDSRDAFLERAEDAENVRLLVDAAGDRPLIVAGDLNSTQHQWSYWHIARGLRDATIVGGRSFVGTYHARLPVFRIDHILVSPHWSVAHARVLRSPRSDHYPVYARLTLTAGRQD